MWNWLGQKPNGYYLNGEHVWLRDTVTFPTVFNNTGNVNPIYFNFVFSTWLISSIVAVMNAILWNQKALIFLTYVQCTKGWHILEHIFVWQTAGMVTCKAILEAKTMGLNPIGAPGTTGCTDMGIRLGNGRWNSSSWSATIQSGLDRSPLSPKAGCCRGKLSQKDSCLIPGSTSS